MSADLSKLASLLVNKWGGATRLLRNWRRDSPARAMFELSGIALGAFRS
jgi:hypothetical protein